jgi:hypothetical protein
MRGSDIPKKLNKKDGKQQVLSFSGFPINILEKKIKKGKIQ